MKTSISPLTLVAILAIVTLCSCAPQREFVQFGNPGTFHPGPRQSGDESSGHDGEYDSYELVDHGGVPNQGIPPMYSRQQAGVLQADPNTTQALSHITAKMSETTLTHP